MRKLRFRALRATYLRTYVGARENNFKVLPYKAGFKAKKFGRVGLADAIILEREEWQASGNDVSHAISKETMLQDAKLLISYKASMDLHSCWANVFETVYGITFSDVLQEDFDASISLLSRAE